MRIRKRFPPPSLSSLPLSDPQLSRSLVVQPHPHVEEEVKSNPNQSDRHNQQVQNPTSQQMVIGTENPISGCARNSSTDQKQEIEAKEIKDVRWKTQEEAKKISNDIRKESNSSAEVDMQFPQSSSSCQAFDRWGERDKIVPPKKRRGSFERMGCQETIIKPKMKSKTNKKCLEQNGHDVEDHDTKKKTTSSSTKKSKRGSVIMEGSRCSRVNGRGWRCCQQTLVGYSLCEHHLGKGRLRSMTSVRNRAMAHNITSSTAANDQDHQNKININELAPRLTQKQEIITITKSSSTTNIGHIGHIAVVPEEDERKPSMMSRKKKMMKIGAVKARSISSLLGQTDSTDAAAPNRNKNSSTTS